MRNSGDASQSDKLIEGLRDEQEKNGAKLEQIMQIVKDLAKEKSNVSPISKKSD